MVIESGPDPTVLDKAIEEVFVVLRPRAAFRVILDRHDRQLPMAQALTRAVIQVEVAQLRATAQSIGSSAYRGFGW